MLLAHQDDEIGVLGEIARARRGGQRVVVAYLTDGAARGVSAADRNAESLSVLTRFGVDAGDVHFLGEAHAIADGVLINHLDTALVALGGLAARIGPLGRIVMHGWEGGHQDHDAVHLVGAALAHQLGLLAMARQFPLYRAPLSGRLPYVMLRPLPANGPVEGHALSWAQRASYLRACAAYRSQRRTFAGLLPFIVADYVLRGRQVLQPVTLARLAEPPHPGLLLYERWRRTTWRDFAARSGPFLTRHGLR